MDIKRQAMNMHEGVLTGLPMNGYYSNCQWFPNGKDCAEQLSMEGAGSSNYMNNTFIQSPTDSIAHTFSQSPTHEGFNLNLYQSNAMNYSLPHNPMRSNSWDASAYYMLSNPVDNNCNLSQSPVSYNVHQSVKDMGNYQGEMNEIKNETSQCEGFPYAPMHSYQVFDDSSLNSIYQPNIPGLENMENFSKRRSKSMASEMDLIPNHMLPYNLEVHDLAVMLTRPFQCAFPGCGKMFKRSEHLKRHYRSIHTNDRPYVCDFPECSKKFSRTDNLAQHVKIHKPAGCRSKPTSRKNSVSSSSGSTGSQFKFLQLGRPSNSLKNATQAQLSHLNLNLSPGFSIPMGLDPLPENYTDAKFH